MLLAYFRVRYAKSRMVAYVNGQLPQAARRRIARYIDQYPACYAEYRHQQQVMREMEGQLSRVGQAEKPAFDRMWAAIQSELNAESPAPVSFKAQPQGVTVHFRVRYGVMALVLALGLVLPLRFGTSRSAFADTLSQPIPLTATVQPLDAKTATADGQAIMMLVGNQGYEVTPPAPAVASETPIDREN